MRAVSPAPFVSREIVSQHAPMHHVRPTKFAMLVRVGVRLPFGVLAMMSASRQAVRPSATSIPFSALKIRHVRALMSVSETVSVKTQSALTRALPVNVPVRPFAMKGLVSALRSSRALRTLSAMRVESVRMGYVSVAAKATFSVQMSSAAETMVDVAVVVPIHPSVRPGNYVVMMAYVSTRLHARPRPTVLVF